MPKSRPLTNLGRSLKPILDAITGAKGTRAARSQMTLNLMSWDDPSVLQSGRTTKL